jgi:hypothetical protein
MRTDVAISIVPANEASWDDLKTVFGTHGDASRCQCQWFKTAPAQWRAIRVEERAERLREQTGCGHPGARNSSGLVAYLDGEPVGWCAVEPRSVYVHLLGSRGIFADAGFAEVSRPTSRRVVMRIDFCM